MIQSFREDMIHKYMYLNKKTATKTDGRLEEVGLHRGQPVLLHLLWEKDGLSGRELSDLMEVQPATVTKMVRRLKTTGFVKTKQDPKDSRISRVYLTDQGKGVESQVKDIFRDLENIMFKGFTSDQRGQFHGFLDQIRENLGSSKEEEKVDKNE